MAYIFKQKFDIRELTGQPKAVKRVMVFEPEIDLCGLYAYHISAADYFVKSCSNSGVFINHLQEFLPHLLLVNHQAVLSQSSSFFKKIRQEHPELLVITIGLGAGAEDLKNLMSSGVSAHLDRRTTKPQDIVAVIASLLN